MQKLPAQCLDRRPNLLLHYEGSSIMFLPIGFWVFVEKYPFVSFQEMNEKENVLICRYFCVFRFSNY